LTVADADIERKLLQARFHLDHLRTAHAAQVTFEVECYFAAAIACLRSAAMYAHEWHVANGRTNHKDDWSAINTWEATLAPEDNACWRAVVEFRNKDIHKTPIAPQPGWRGGWNGGWSGAWFGSWFGGELAHQATNPKTGVAFDVVETCERGLNVMTRLLADYKSLR